MLLTRLPLPIAEAFDLHVLGLPPAFVLSQDQTLKLYRDFILTGHCSLLKSPKHTEPRFAAAIHGVLKIRDRQYVSSAFP